MDVDRPVLRRLARGVGRRVLAGAPLLLAALLVAAVVPGAPARAAAPDGPRIVFSVDTRPGGVCCRLDVATMRPDGSGVRLLTHSAKGTFTQNAAWSADGASILFSQRPSGPLGTAQIWTVRTDGTGQRRLIADPFFADLAPTPSPDGADVVFSRCRPDFSACALYRADSRGAHLTELLPFQTETVNFTARYSPDGSRIAFGSFGRAGVQGAVYVMRADGSGLHRVTPAGLGAAEPSWLPDGRSLLVASRCCTPAHSAIWRVPLDGSPPVQVSRPGARHDFSPTPSPDGRQIAFERDNPDFTGFEVWLMRADGSGAHRVGPAFSGFPVWGPGR